MDPSEQSDAVATLQFRHDQKNSGVSRRGRLRPGAGLQIQYDPARLLNEHEMGNPHISVMYHLRFQPSGEEHSGRLTAQTGSMRRRDGAVRPLAVEMQIPAATTQVELWFEGRDGERTTGWDSRFGQNYTFGTAEEGVPIPQGSVMLRDNAEINPDCIRVVEDAASKEQVAIGSGTRLQTALVIRAQVPQPAASATVWADVHVFDALGDRLHTVSLTLEPEAQPPTSGLARLWGVEVYPGSGGASGMGVWSRPDAHIIQYRLYCQVGSQVLTDGVLHQFEVPADTEVRPTAGSW